MGFLLGVVRLVASFVWTKLATRLCAFAAVSLLVAAGGLPAGSGAACCQLRVDEAGHKTLCLRAAGSLLVAAGGLPAGSGAACGQLRVDEAAVWRAGSSAAHAQRHTLHVLRVRHLLSRHPD